MQLTNQEEKHRAAVNPSWLQACPRFDISEAHQAPAPTKAAGHHCPPIQHTKEVLISTDYNLEEALISTN